MTKRLLSVALCLAVVAHGMAYADEAAAGITLVRDREALAAHIDRLEEGDHVVLATDEGVVSGAMIDKDADELVIDQPLVQGGTERIVVARREIQGLRYQSAQPPQAHVTAKSLLITAVVVGGLLLLVRLLVPVGP
jgi:hypothetical protein